MIIICDAGSKTLDTNARVLDFSKTQTCETKQIFLSCTVSYIIANSNLSQSWCNFHVANHLQHKISKICCLCFHLLVFKCNPPRNFVKHLLILKILILLPSGMVLDVL